MATVRYGQGITEMTGKMGGVYFHRDRFGHHISAQKRKIYSRTPSQAEQRNAFKAARLFCSNYNCIRYNIYRALNNLPLEHRHEAL